MTQFIQLHFLTSYPPANLNRDDMGRPKTARMGGTERLRVSSQSLKRHWRTSALFTRALQGQIGTRTKRIGVEVYDALLAKGITERNAKKIAESIASQFGKVSKKSSPETEQLVHISPYERQATADLTEVLAQENREPTVEELNLLSNERMAVDIALFGRMLADTPRYNVEAACQVAHALSLHSVIIEDDYFTAIDDLHDYEQDAGSAHIGEAGFAAAVFYQYICINKDLLLDNLNGNEVLSNAAIRAFTEAALTVAPAGKQNSFASRAIASFVLAEKGAQQPRSLSVAYLEAINHDMLNNGIDALVAQANNFDAVYGDCADERVVCNAYNHQAIELNNLKKTDNTLRALLDFLEA